MSRTSLEAVDASVAIDRSRTQCPRFCELASVSGDCGIVFQGPLLDLWITSHAAKEFVAFRRFSFLPRRPSEDQMNFRRAEFPRLGLLADFLGLLEAVQPNVARRQIAIVQSNCGIEAKRGLAFR